MYAEVIHLPAPKTAPKKKSPAKPKKLTEKQKKELALQAEKQQKQKRFYMAYGLGFFTLALLALAIIPGQSAWAAMRSWLWDFAGVPLLAWLAFAIYCCSVWLRNRNLRDDWLTLAAQPLLIFFFGVLLSLFTEQGGFFPALLGRPGRSHRHRPRCCDFPAAAACLRTICVPAAARGHLRAHDGTPPR